MPRLITSCDAAGDAAGEASCAKLMRGRAMVAAAAPAAPLASVRRDTDLRLAAAKGFTMDERFLYASVTMIPPQGRRLRPVRCVSAGPAHSLHGVLALSHSRCAYPPRCNTVKHSISP